MKIQSTNFRVNPDVDQYPDKLRMLIVALQIPVLSTLMFSSFSIPMSWLSLAGSTTIYNKAMKLVTFQLTSDKKFKLTNKLFAQTLNLPTVDNFYEVSND